MASRASAEPLVEDDLGLAVPPGFAVSLYADDDLAHDIFSMTFDAQGRVVVAGAGYVKTLHDDDGDGRADRATLFSDVPASGAHGMHFDGDDLVCTGDNAIGCLRDANGDGRADGPMEVWARLGHSEHGANGLVRGPDGWYYVVCGNDAGVGEEHVQTDTSPVKHPQAGAIVRFSPDGKTSEVYAHGFRNPYDLDFTAEGHLLTVDSDNERDHHLPWYAPTRLFDVAQGMHHGWVQGGHERSWNRPECWFDNVERLCEIGRGSPTGLVVYRHTQFPEHYRGGAFSACWSTGRVYYFPLERHEASYKKELEVFLQTTGNVGFAPTDLAVSPEGDLFVSIGGRGTRGGVFRVGYVGDGANADQSRDHQSRDRKGAGDAAPTRSAAGGDAHPPLPDGRGSDFADTARHDPLTEVLACPQPLTSWSRAKWLPLARRLGPRRLKASVRDVSRPVRQRMRAMEVLIELHGGLTLAEARRVLDKSDDEVAARMLWALGRAPSDGTSDLLGQMTEGESLTRRAAFDAIATLPEFLPSRESWPNWRTACADRVRRVRSAAWLAAASLGGLENALQSSERNVLIMGPPSSRQLVSHFVQCIQGGSVQDEDRVRTLSLAVFCLFGAPPLDRGVEELRLMQIACEGVHAVPVIPEVFTGYLGRELEWHDAESEDKVVSLLARRIDQREAGLDYSRERARLLAMLEADVPGLPEQIVAQWTDDSEPEDDIHYLICLARLPGERSPEVTRQTAHALSLLHHKMHQRGYHPSRNWPLRVGECFDELLKKDPALAEALADDPAFGLADHSLFALRMPVPQKQLAARKLLAAAQAAVAADDDARPWTAELVQLVATLPSDESLPVLREQWDDYGLRDAITLVVVRHRRAEDRGRLVEALESTQADVIAAAAEALAAYDPPATPAELAAALSTQRVYTTAPQQRAVRQSLGRLLAHWTQPPLATDEPDGADPVAFWQPWFDWFAAAHPNESARLAAAGTADWPAWQERLARIDWAAGDAARGQPLFERRQCHRCHRGSGRLGPDLPAAVARLSREELFAAIVDPSREVSPTYRTYAVSTTAGQVYTGLLVYESPDATLVETGPDVTVRVSGQEFQAIQPSRQSLMPQNLLNEATDQDLADLYAYLKALSGSQ